MVFTRTDAFKRDYKKLPSAIQKKFIRQLTIFSQNRKHPALAAQKMTGKDDIWEARVDYHYRFTFKIGSHEIVLRRIGTHEIYRKP